MDPCIQHLQPQAHFDKVLIRELYHNSTCVVSQISSTIAHEANLYSLAGVVVAYLFTGHMSRASVWTDQHTTAGGDPPP